MKVTAQSFVKSIRILAITPLAAIMLASNVTEIAAGGRIVCRPGGSCTIGEFLYDDDYVPIETATCTLTSQTPAGGGLYSNQPMPHGSDGWYAYSFTAPVTEGYYPSEVCCTAGTDYLCIDKGFSVETEAVTSANDVADAVWDEAAADHNSAGTMGNAVQNVTASVDVDEAAVATAVWGYTNRSLTTFGNLAADIWSSSERTLTSLADFMDDIWSYKDRELTSIDNLESTGNITIGGSGVDNTTLELIKKQVGENRNLLEALVNKPIVENFLEFEDDVDLEAKLSQSEEIVESLSIQAQMMKARVDGLSLGVDSLADASLRAEVEELRQMIGGEDDLNRETIYSRVNWLVASWDFESLVEIEGKVSSIAAGLVGLEKLGELERQEKLDLVVSDARELVQMVGSIDDENGKSLVGQVAALRRLADRLGLNLGEVEQMLASGELELVQVRELTRQVEEINQLNNLEGVLAFEGLEDVNQKALRNKALAMRGVIVANKKALALPPGQAFSTVWLEEGSMVFKSVMTNPSARISQTVPLKLYLPDELKEEDVLGKDDGLRVGYDVERDQLFVEGEFVLGPLESKTVALRTEDVWVISLEEVESLRRYVDSMAEPLRNTSFFAQGSTLAADIHMALDKVSTLGDGKVTPELRIKAYREAAVELAGVMEKIERLEDLVTQAGAAGSMKGFVGGSQAVAIWGVILVVVLGFVSLGVYMRTLYGPGGQTRKMNKKRKKTKAAFYIQELHKPGKIEWGRLGLPLGMVLVGGGIALGSALLTRKMVLEETVGAVSGEELEELSQEVVETKEVEVENQQAVGGVDVVSVVVEGKPVLVRQQASEAAEVIDTIPVSRDVIRLGNMEGWTLVVVKDPADVGEAVTGWVESRFVQGGGYEQEMSVKKSVEVEEKVLGESERQGNLVKIMETETGWLRVRVEPGGEELAKVNAGGVYEWLQQAGDWVQIELDDGTIGWVSQRYVEFNQEPAR